MGIYTVGVLWIDTQSQEKQNLFTFSKLNKTSNKDKELKNPIAVGRASAVKVGYDSFSMRNRNHRFRVNKI